MTRARQVLEIVAAALQAMGNSHPDAARGFLDAAVKARPSLARDAIPLLTVA